MNDGQLLALDYSSGNPIEVRWRNGIIEQINPAPARERPTQWVAPALIDLQINGYGGIDFQQDDLTFDNLTTAANALRRDGCSRFFLTLITDDWPRLVERFRHVHRLRHESAELLHAIAGWHIEGPFLSDQPGFHGAHQPAFMRDPTQGEIRQLHEIAAGDPLLLTMAPERPGAIEAIRLARSLGITISLGHTDASAVTIEAAISAGATAFTHLANGCPRELDRHDNIIWRIADAAQLTVSLIPDGNHVSPAPFRALHRLLGNRIYYTSDAMSAAGAAPGKYRLGPMTLEVGPDQIVRQPGRTNFAGSALRPIDGVFRASTTLRVPWHASWHRFSEKPAALVGLKHGLRHDCPADFCLLEFDGDKLIRFETFVRGEKSKTASLL